MLSTREGLARQLLVLDTPHIAKVPYSSGGLLMAVHLSAGPFEAYGSDAIGGVYYIQASTGRIEYQQQKDGEFSEGYDKVRVGIYISPTGGQHVFWLWDGYTKPEMAALPYDTLAYRTEQRFYDAPGGFRSELVYGGRSGSSITMLYREYINDMARPAYTQELRYDLSGDDLIGFRGARFRVASAGNTAIRYVVLSPLRAQNP